MPRRFSHRLLLFASTMAVSAGAGAKPALAQYAAAANIGLSVVPVTLGAVQLSANGSVDRHVSWAAPRTVLTLGTAAAVGSPDAGFSLGLAAEGTAETDSLPPVITLKGGLWRSFGNLLLRLDVAERALRFGGHDGGTQINQHWIDSLETDSGFVAYHVLKTDTTILPATPSHLSYWPEVQAGAEWSSGRLRLEAMVGGRNGVGTTPRAFWGHVGGTMELTHGLALALTAGTSPTLIGLGVPSARYVSVAVHIASRHANASTGVASATRRRAFAVRPLGAQRYTVTYSGADLSDVQLSGDFNRWTPIALREMGGDHERWETTLTLAPGAYHISLRVNRGPWFAPPGTPVVTDDFGGTSGLLVVR